MIAFGHDEQLDRASERAERAKLSPLCFTCPGVNRRTDENADGHADHRRDRSPFVHEYLLADRAV
jgi:hypothetical protein